MSAVSAAGGHAGRVVRVLPDVTALRKLFDYTVPDAFADRVRVGTQVRVPLHGRRVAGWVVADEVRPPEGVTLRPLAGVRGWGPPPAVLALAEWAAWRWAGPVSSLLRTASCSVAVRALPTAPPVANPPGAPGAVDPFVRAAFEEGPTVVRLAPAEDPFPLVDTAARLLVTAADDAGVLVLAPAQRAAADLAGRLRRAGRRVALLPQDWASARAGGCVTVGTRAAAFAPLPRLAAAVVLDAHDEVYHEERAPTWCAWQVVVERARREGAPCVLVSPCPTLEVLGAGRLVTTSRHAERRGWPPLEIVDRRGDDPRSGMFSGPLVDLLRWGRARSGRRIVCVVNRTGRVRLLACAACHELARCEECRAAVELVDLAVDGAAPEGTPPHLRCRRCGTRRPVVCPRCGAGRMKALRLGVTRVREELEALAGVPVAAVWGPAPRPGPEPAARPADAGGELDVAAVVVGTEAVLHRLEVADGVAFLDFDSELLAPRLRAGEEALALLARAARLVAGASRPGASHRGPGRVLVQTRMPYHDALVAAVRADPGRLVAAEWEIRRALALPPVTALAVVSGPSADVYGEALRASAPAEVAVRGPVDGTWSVRAPDYGVLCDALAAVDRASGRLRIEVDPVRV